METNDILDKLGSMSVMELIALTKTLEDKWGVKAEPQLQLQEATVDLPVETTQTEFDVILVSVPLDKKIAVVKIVRELTGLGLKESKDLVEAAPKAIKESVTKAEADAIVAKLAETGAKVDVK